MKDVPKFKTPDSSESLCLNSKFKILGWLSPLPLHIENILFGIILGQHFYPISDFCCTFCDKLRT